MQRNLHQYVGTDQVKLDLDHRKPRLNGTDKQTPGAPDSTDAVDALLTQDYASRQGEDGRDTRGVRYPGKTCRKDGVINCITCMMA